MSASTNELGQIHNQIELLRPELVIQLPDIWIDPNILASNLPPYYSKIVKGYDEWMRKPHSDLTGLPWGDNLIQLYKPRNPEFKKTESDSPSTYFIYEALYMLTASIISGNISPIAGLENKRANYLQQKIGTNLLEILNCITNLSNRKIAFNTEHDKTKGSFKFLGPITRNKNRRYPYISAKTSINYSELVATFVPEIRSFLLDFRELDSGLCFPESKNGIGKSSHCGIRLERARSKTDERLLQMDLDISDLIWGNREDGKFMPMENIFLLDEYLGEKVHHLNLAQLNFNGSKRHEIDTITYAVMDELGLETLRSQPVAN